MQEGLDCDVLDRLYDRREFLGIVLDPPDFRPGSWIGAGKAIYDHARGEFILTARPRRAENRVRGYAANIYGSETGMEYRPVATLSKADVSRIAGMEIHSIEGTQLLRNPDDARWHLFLSVDTGGEFVWGGVEWETLLLTGDSLTGPWNSHGIVIPNDREFDSNQSRDATVDVIDRTWYCIYKAKNSSREERPALATSEDGMNFEKRGTMTIDAEDRLAFLSGTIFPSNNGPVFVGLETKLSDSRKRSPDVVYADDHGIGHGGGPPSNFVAYRLRADRLDLQTVVRVPWTPLSQYERPDHPLLGYSSLLIDPHEDRLLMYVESIDPQYTKAMGLNETVERVLAYGIAL
jgi:hypothetical protein